MNHYFVLVTAGFAPAKSFVVRADSYRSDDGVTSFLRDERVVHALPSPAVAAIRPFDNRRAADEALAASRNRHGAATIHLQESAAPAAKAQTTSSAAMGAPAEGLRVVIDER